MIMLMKVTLHDYDCWYSLNTVEYGSNIHIVDRDKEIELVMFHESLNCN